MHTIERGIKGVFVMALTGRTTVHDYEAIVPALESEIEAGDTLRLLWDVRALEAVEPRVLASLAVGHAASGASAAADRATTRLTDREQKNGGKRAWRSAPAEDVPERQRPLAQAGLHRRCLADVAEFESQVWPHEIVVALDQI